MRKIKVVFTRPASFSFISLIFRLFEGTTYSHAALCLISTDLVNLVAHSNRHNVHVNTEKYFNKIYTTLESLEFEISDEKYDYLVAEISKYEGAIYGYLNIFGIFISRVAKFFGIRMRNIFSDKSKTFFCSEFVYQMLHEIGFNLKDFDSELDGPRKLFEILKGIKNE